MPKLTEDDYKAVHPVVVTKRLMKAGVPLVSLKVREKIAIDREGPHCVIYVDTMEKPTRVKVRQLMTALSGFIRAKVHKVRFDYENDLYRIYFHAWLHPDMVERAIAPPKRRKKRPK